NMTVTNTATSTTATTFNFMTTLSATTPVSHPVSGDSRNVELGHFLVINSGPDMQINSMAFTVLGTAPANSLMNINLYDVNGTRIAEQTTDNGSTFYFKYLPIVKSGKDLKVIVKADISSSITSADNGKTIGVAFAAGKATNTSNNTVVDMGKSVNANLMTLSTANISKPSITLITPNGGENFTVGGKVAVYWKTTGDMSKVSNFILQFSKKIDSESSDVFNIDLGSNDGNEVVTIPTAYRGPSPVGGLYSVRILGISETKDILVMDYADQLVGIKATSVAGCTSTTAPWIKVLSPNGGESYKAGDKVAVKWESCNIPTDNNIRIQFFEKTKGVSFFTIDLGQNDGSEVVSMSKTDYYGNTLINSLHDVRIITLSPDKKYDVIDEADSSVYIKAEETTSSKSCGQTVSNIKDLPYNSPGVSFQFFPDSSIDTAEIGTKDVSIGDGFYVNGKGCLTELSLDFYSGWEGSVLEDTVYLINSDGAILDKAVLNNYQQATFENINFELDGQDTLFVAVDLADNFKPQNVLHILNQHVTIMGYKYIRADHDTVYNITDGVNRLGTAIVYDQNEPQTIPISHLYIKNTTKSNKITASSKRNTKIATFDMRGYLGAKPGNITFQFGPDASKLNLNKNSLYFVNTKTGDRAKLISNGLMYTFDFSEVRHEWDTLQTYALYVNKPKASSRPKTYPVSYRGVQEANNMDGYSSDVMFLRLTVKK
ncbi:MAG: hypothetical protein KBB86_03355, partial [Candidatus Pacebacteria bacterium]|nr:hypothetical protein [Candidatus Paceibacterota bacterium]